jgi:hypothetical protein
MQFGFKTGCFASSERLNIAIHRFKMKIISSIAMYILTLVAYDMMCVCCNGFLWLIIILLLYL